MNEIYIRLAALNRQLGHSDELYIRLFEDGSCKLYFIGIPVQYESSFKDTAELLSFLKLHTPHGEIFKDS